MVHVRTRLDEATHRAAKIAAAIAGVTLPVYLEIAIRAYVEVEAQENEAIRKVLDSKSSD